MPTVIGPSGMGKLPQSRGQPSIKLHCSSPSSASQRSATFRASCRTVLTSRVTSSGRKSVSASTVNPYETREAHFVSMKSSSGAADSVRRVASGRNEVVLRRRQRQWNSRGLDSVKVPNKVRNVPDSIEFSGGGPSSLPVVLKCLGVAPMLCHASQRLDNLGGTCV